MRELRNGSTQGMRRLTQPGVAAMLGVALLAALTGRIAMADDQHSHEAEQPAASPAPQGQPPDMPRHPRHISAAVPDSFQPFRATKVSLPFTFDYPVGWSAGEEQGKHSPYQQVLVLGPRNAQDTYTAGFIVRLLPTKAAGGTHANADELVHWRRTQVVREDTYEWVKDQPIELLGMKGTELEFRSEMKLPPHGTQGGTAIPTSVTTRAIVLSHGNRLVELQYSADAHDYERYRPAFEHLLSSLRLKESAASP